MIEYYEQLSEEEQDDIKHVIQTLYRQTFLLERKFEKRTGRMVPVREYRVCSKHREFLEKYFAVAGITLQENLHMGVMYIQGETLWGEKLSRLATIYILVLKLIYDEADGSSVIQQPYRDHSWSSERKSGRIPCVKRPAVPDRDAEDRCIFEKISDCGTCGCDGGAG